MVIVHGAKAGLEHDVMLRGNAIEYGLRMSGGKTQLKSAGT